MKHFLKFTLLLFMVFSEFVKASEKNHLPKQKLCAFIKPKYFLFAIDSLVINNSDSASALQKNREYSKSKLIQKDSLDRNHIFAKVKMAIERYGFENDLTYSNDIFNEIKLEYYSSVLNEKIADNFLMKEETINKVIKSYLDQYKSQKTDYNSIRFFVDKNNPVQSRGFKVATNYMALNKYSTLLIELSPDISCKVYVNNEYLGNTEYIKNGIKMHSIEPYSIKINYDSKKECIYSNIVLNPSETRVLKCVLK